MTTRPKFGSRVGLVRPFQVKELLDRALTPQRQRYDIIRLGLGEADFATAESIIGGRRR
ncbi:MAG: hypothetical protein V3U43_06645 [Pseudomonadales bacterium]